jgi:Fic family protein
MQCGSTRLRRFARNKCRLPVASVGRMDELLTSIAAKKERLDAMRPVSRAALLALQKSWDVDLTYTSNAIEGNTLTLRETAELIEHGITVGGKPLRDHLEAVDHYNAVLWMRELAAKHTPIDENTVRELHRRIVARSQPEIGATTAPFLAVSPVPPLFFQTH